MPEPSPAPTPEAAPTPAATPEAARAEEADAAAAAEPALTGPAAAAAPTAVRPPMPPPSERVGGAGAPALDGATGDPSVSGPGGPAADPSSGLAERIGVIRWERDADGIVVLTLDAPGQQANTTGAAFRRSLGAAVERLERERATVTGVVVTSVKPAFATGADLRELVDLADPRAAYDLATAGKDPLRRLETLGRPVVAAIGGAALGGGLEIALACHHRIALDAPGTQLGLPEATLGLMPSGGGVVRSVRLLGLRNALVNVLLQGQRYSAARGRAIGLVDGLVATRDALLPAAKAWITAQPAPVARWDTPGYQLPGGGPASPALAAALASLPAGLRRQPPGATREAGPAILAAAVEGAQLDVDTAFVVESRYFAELVTSQTARNLLGAFFVDMGRLAADGAGAGVDAGAAGGGVAAGAGVAAAGAAAAGAAAAGAAAAGAAAAGGAGGRGRFEAPRAFVDRLLGAYLAEAAALVGEGVPAPSIEQAGTQAGFRSSPLRLCDEVSLATARAAIAGPSAGETEGSGRDGAALAVVDRMTGEWARPGRAGGAGFYDYADGRRVGLWPGLREQLGAKTQSAGETGSEVWAVMGAPAAGPGPGPGLGELKERLLFAVALRAVGCLDDGLVGSVAAANVASLTGAGFPAWTGGALRYVNGYPGGVGGFVARARELAARHGDRFAPPPTLVERAERDEPYV